MVELLDEGVFDADEEATAFVFVDLGLPDRKVALGL